MRDGLPAAPVSRTDFAAHQDPRARTKPLEERGAEMEPEEEQRRVGVVAQQDFEPAPPVSALHLVHLGDGACDDASLAERRVGDQAGRAPVFVADGKVEENVVDGDESLPAQPLGDGRTDAAQPLHRSLESLRGHRAARRRKERGRRQRGIGRHGPFATRGLRHSREIRDFLGDRDEPPETAIAERRSASGAASNPCTAASSLSSPSVSRAKGRAAATRRRTRGSKSRRAAVAPARTRKRSGGNSGESASDRPPSAPSVLTAPLPPPCPEGTRRTAPRGFRTRARRRGRGCGPCRRPRARSIRGRWGS